MNVRRLKSLVPWQVRIALKVVLARLPVSFGTWRRLRLFQHGSMHQASYVWFVFERHLAAHLAPGGLAGRTLLELGPGDGIASGLLASCLGAERTVLVDAGDFASRDPRTYDPMIEDWEARGLDVEHLRGCTTFEELCAAGRTAYRTAGLASLRELPTAAFDLQVSNAVLEHVRAAEFDATLAELRRTLAPDGLGKHAVDLKDHLGGALNNLRFSDARWESELFTRSGFYTNRIRHREMLARMEAAGFATAVPRTWTWDALPTPRARMAARFRDLGEEDLLVSGFDVELRCAPVVPCEGDTGPQAAGDAGDTVEAPDPIRPAGRRPLGQPVHLDPRP